MDGKLALYSGAVFAGVLIAGTIAIRGADSGTTATSGNSAVAAAADPVGGSQPAGNRSLLSRFTSFVSHDDDDDEYEDDEHEGYEHHEDDD